MWKSGLRTAEKGGTAARPRLPTAGGRYPRSPSASSAASSSASSVATSMTSSDAGAGGQPKRGADSNCSNGDGSADIIISHADQARIDAAIAAVLSRYGADSKRGQKPTTLTLPLRKIHRKPSGNWQAHVSHAGKARHLGTWPSKEDASLAHEVARELLEPLGADDGDAEISEEEAQRNLELAKRAARQAVADRIHGRAPPAAAAAPSDQARISAAAAAGQPTRGADSNCNDGCDSISPADQARIDAAIAGVLSRYGAGSKLGQKATTLTLPLRHISLRPSGNWRAQVSHAGKARHLGTWPSREDASLAYEVAKELLDNLGTDDGSGSSEGEMSEEVAQRNVELARGAVRQATTERNCKHDPSDVAPSDRARVTAAIAAVQSRYGTGAKANKRLASLNHKGVTMRSSGKWQAQLYYAGKSRYLGVLESKEDASLGYEVARELLGNPVEEEAQRNVWLAQRAALQAVAMGATASSASSAAPSSFAAASASANAQNCNSLAPKRSGGAIPGQQARPQKSIPKSILKHRCPGCKEDVRRPPPGKGTTDSAISNEVEPLEASLDRTTVICALESCPARRYHLKCTGLPRGSNAFRCAVISDALTGKNEDDRKCDANLLLQHLYSPSEGLWWNPSPALDGGSARSQMSLYRDKSWSTSMESFVCPSCDVEGASRYLLEYFEVFRTMKESFYKGVLGDQKKSAIANRLERADECVEARTGEAFLWHLMQGNQRIDEATREWKPSELQLDKMERALNFLSKNLQQQQLNSHQRRQKRQKTNFHLGPSYLVGMPVRLFNPVDNSYHSGRIVDYKRNAAYQLDKPLSECKSDTAEDAAVDVGQLADEKIINTLFLVRFRNGVEGRRLPVHQWMFLEEHAVTIGGEVCWAKVDENQPSTTKAGQASGKAGDSSGANSPQNEQEEYAAPYRPVQIVYRSMLEMFSAGDLNPSNSKRNGKPPLNVLALGFGRGLSTVRLSLSDGEMTPRKAAKAAVPSRPEAIPLTTINPTWIDRALHRALLSDDDVAHGLAMACVEKEEERRIRAWRRLSVSHLTQSSTSEISSPPVSISATPRTATPVEGVKRHIAYETSPEGKNISQTQARTASENGDSGSSEEMDSQKENSSRATPSSKDEGVNSPDEKRQKSYQARAEARVMRQLKDSVDKADPRPCLGCYFCGPRRSLKGPDELCSSCRWLQTQHGWTCRVVGDKKKFTNGVGGKVGTIKEYLETTTALVAKDFRWSKEKSSRKRIRDLDEDSDDSEIAAKKRRESYQIRAENAFMRKLKQSVDETDPRPCFGCYFCGPKRSLKGPDDLCSTCQWLQKRFGWTCSSRGATKRYANKNGERCTSIQAFLESTTAIVAKEMVRRKKSSSKKGTKNVKDDVGQSGNKKRGRPRKHPLPESEAGSNSSPVKKKRGRPRKRTLPNSAVEDSNYLLDRHMKQMKRYVRQPDPRPCIGCYWCGPKCTWRGPSDLCSSCRWLRKRDGWRCTHNEASRKKTFSNKHGENKQVLREFLERTTGLVAAREMDRKSMK